MKCYIKFLFALYFSGVTCPEGMIFDPCASPCQPTCLSTIFGESPCEDSACIETCRCPDGQLMDGDMCVDPEDCGCLDENAMYRPVRYCDIFIEYMIQWYVVRFVSEGQGHYKGKE